MRSASELKAHGSVPCRLVDVWVSGNVQCYAGPLHCRYFAIKLVDAAPLPWLQTGGFCCAACNVHQRRLLDEALAQGTPTGKKRRALMGARPWHLRT